MVNPVSAGGFAAAAGHYARSRPAYARGAIGLLTDAIAPGPILDLAAGTGILTGQLLRAGREVLACEPLPEMLAQLRLALPDAPAVVGSAESLPVATATVSGVCVAQAFHWFDAPRALDEIARVLRPGGTMALVWNVRDESVPWVRELTDIVERRSGGRPYSDHRDHHWEDVVAACASFGDAIVERFANPVTSSPAALQERVRSTSFVAVMDPVGREALLREVAALVRHTPELAGRERFDYPHDTVVYLWSRSA